MQQALPAQQQAVRGLWQLARKKRWHAYALALLWLGVNGWQFLHTGIVTGFEAEKYISNADHWLQTGRLAGAQFYYYRTQILLIALAKQTGSFPYLPVLVQLAVNAVATFCFYQLLWQVHQCRSMATAGTALLLGMVYYQAYNWFLFTESIYFSGVIICLYALFQARNRNRKWMLLLPLILAWLACTRPVSIFLLPATIMFLLLRADGPVSIKQKGWIAGIALAGFLVLVNRAMNAGGAFDFLAPFSTGQILCGVPAAAPAYSLPASINPNSLQGIGYMVIQHPRFFAHIALERLLSFWSLKRSFYAPVHNLFLAVYFYPLYLLSLWGIKKWRKSDYPLLGFIITLILLTSLAAILSCDDWHNRFIFPLLPLLIILASFAARSIAKK